MENNNILQEKIYNYIKAQTKPISLNKIAIKLGLDSETVKKVTDYLRENTKIILTNDKFSIFPKDNYIGTVCISKSKNKFIVYGSKKIPVDINTANTAILDDTVSFKINHRKEAIITSVIKRSIDTMTCEVSVNKGRKRLIPYHTGIEPIINPKDMKGLVDGDIIRVKNNFSTNQEYANCEFIERIGNVKDPTIMEQIILENNGIPYGYSEEYMQELESIPDEIKKEDYPDRVDMTDMPFVTIDGDNTMDIDDGLYGIRNPDGSIRIYTFLTPMPALIKFDGAIYNRAYEKQFTNYFINDCDPLYHQKISTGIGSLNENELRLTTVIAFDVDKNGKISNPDMIRALGISRKKMTGSQVDEVLKGNIPKGYEKYSGMLHLLYEAAINVEKSLLKNEMLELPSNDVEVTKNNGKIINISHKEKTKADRLIEYLMIPTNIAAIMYLESKDVNLLPFRNHDNIDIKKLNEFIANYNDKIKKINSEIKKKKKNNWQIEVKGKTINVEPQELEKFLPYIGSKYPINEINATIRKLEEPQKSIFVNFVTSSISRAYYSINCNGHAGLGLKKYAHTTADIRRFLDGYYHLILDKINEDPKWLEKHYMKYYRLLDEACKKATIMERRADNAEGDGLRYEMLKSIEPYKGQEFKALVIDASKNKIRIKFNELYEYVSYASLDEDNFIYDKEKGLYFDKYNNKYLKPGSEVIFRLDAIHYSNLTYEVTINGIIDSKKLIKNNKSNY